MPMNRRWIRLSETMDRKIREEAASRNISGPDFTRHLLELGLAKLGLAELTSEISKLVHEQNQASAAAGTIHPELMKAIFFCEEFLRSWAVKSVNPIADAQLRTEQKLRRLNNNE